MKKMKKLLTGLLALVMTITTVAIQSPITAKAATPTIDNMDATGSLTIHKYEYNQTGGTATGSTGDASSIPVGSTSESADNIAIPLDDVTFRVTFVAKLDTYYAEDGLDLPKVSGYSAIYDDAYYTANTSKEGSTFTNIGDWMTVTTKNGGLAEIMDMPLGIYLVQEISAPAQITQTAVDFLVSIPMTNAAGDDWLYNVNVYPKNKSAYGAVELVKSGKVGGATATALNGAYFVLEKYDADTKTWNRVAENNKGVAIGTTVTIDSVEEKNVLTTATLENTDGKIAVANLAPGTYRFREIGIQDTSYIVDKSATYEFQITTEGKVMQGTAELTTPIQVVNNKPNVQKEVQNDDGDWGDDADYSKGDAVPFRIIVDVPANIVDLKTFTVADTLSSGLTLTDNDKSSFVIKGYTTTEAVDSDGTGTVIDSRTQGITFNGQTWTADFTDNFKQAIKDNRYVKVVIEFTATLNENAVVAGDGNPNDVTLTYSNQVLTDATQTPPTSVLKDKVVVYTFQFGLTKTFDTPTENGAYTATFQLYRETEKSTDTALKVGNNTVYAVAVGDAVVLTATGTKNGDDVIASATHTFTDLENGTYYLVETKTTSGYNLLKDPVKVEIQIAYETTFTTDTDGSINTETKYYTVDDSGNQTTTEITAPNTHVTSSVANSKGFTLPSTGGVGTYIFVFVGVSMMAAAVILFFTTKKKEAQKN